MDRILLPGLIGEITSLLDDESISNLKLQSNLFNQLLSQEESLGYWKYRSLEEASIPLPDLPEDTNLDWKEFYKILKSTNVERAIVATYPTTQLLSWLISRVNEILGDENDDSFILRSLPPGIRKDPIYTTSAYLLLDYILDYDRIDVFRDFIQLVDEVIGEVYLIYLALGSNGGWRILVDLIPKMTKYVSIQENKYGAILKLLEHASKSSDLAHFILVERLFDTSAFTTEVVELLLESDNLELLAYYYFKHSALVKKYLKKLSSAVALMKQKPNYSILSFLVSYLSDKEFSRFTSLVRIQVSNLDSGWRFNSIDAILNDPRVTKEFVIQSLSYKEYQKSGPRLSIEAAANLVRLLKVDVNKLGKLPATETESTNLYYVLFEYLLTTKKMAWKYRRYFNEMLKIRGSDLVLRVEKKKEFSPAEVLKLGNFLISVTDYKDEVRAYYQAKIQDTSLDLEIENTALGYVDEALK